MLNRNNFLRWEGQVDEFPFVNTAGGANISMLTGTSSIDVDLLSVCFASFGVDVNSIVVTYKSDATAPDPIWISTTQRLRIFRPTGFATEMSVRYKFKDNLGNSSIEGTIVVDLTLLSVGWRAYAPSLYCLQSSYNQNTGVKGWLQLEQYLTLSGTAVSPQVLKPNVASDADYVAPVTDTTACPLPTSYPVNVYNTLPTNTAFAINMTWKKTGDPDIVLFMSVGPNQNYTFMLPQNNYTQLIITLNQNVLLTGSHFIEYKNAGAGITITQPITLGAGNLTVTFTNPYINGSSSSIRIY